MYINSGNHFLVQGAALGRIPQQEPNSVLEARRMAKASWLASPSQGRAEPLEKMNQEGSHRTENRMHRRMGIRFFPVNMILSVAIAKRATRTDFV